MKTDVIVIGAGIAGLACAGVLKRAGAGVVVLDKGRGVGGRCATWRYEDQPIDYGLIFLHGSDPDFLAAIDALEGATPIEGWPSRVRGEGTPCQPQAFAEGERRIAFAEGMTVWPKQMARDLEVRLRTRVASLREAAGGVEVLTEDGETLAARDVVLTAPVEQSWSLLATVAARAPDLGGAEAVLGMLASLPCLTVMAAYGPDLPSPDWDVLYPEESEIVQVVSHDSAKRSGRRFLTMVYQALPAWSRAHMEDPEEAWGRELLEEAGRLTGSWAARPLWLRAHRWRFARADGGSELGRPLLVPAPGGARIGIAGDVFAPGGGAQAAWLSGRRLADRLLGRGE